MGQLLSRLGIRLWASEPAEDSQAVSEQPKVYSWDKRNTEFDQEKFSFHDLSDQTCMKLPGEINGEQFTLRNLKNCQVFLFDDIATLMLDDCVNCAFFIGPVHQSIFIRDSRECSVAVSCQQFRVRDCHKMKILLHCVTQPIIETSTRIKFGCFQYYYNQLRDQMSKAGLSPYMNVWSNVYDFSPSSEEENFSYLKNSDEVMSAVTPLPEDERVAGLAINALPSVVPLTTGRRVKFPSIAFLLVLPFEEREEKLRDFFNILNIQGDAVSVVQCKEITISQEELNRILSSSASSNVAAGDSSTAHFKLPMKSKGKVNAVELGGDDCSGVVREALSQLAPLPDYSHLVAESSAARAVRDSFYSFVDMQFK